MDKPAVVINVLIALVTGIQRNDDGKRTLTIREFGALGLVHGFDVSDVAVDETAVAVAQAFKGVNC